MKTRSFSSVAFVVIVTGFFLLRQFVYDTEAIALDGNGRFLIPKRFLEATNITSGVRFIGMDDTIEIWTTDSDMPLMNSQEFAEKLTKVMTPEEK